MARTILELQNVRKFFPIQGGILMREVARVHAVDGVSLLVREGETLGIVGESGCGKSTLGNTIVRLHDATSGRIIFDGNDITRLNRKELRPHRRELQIVFQDPFFSLNPRHTIEKILMEPLLIHRIGRSRKERREIIFEVLEKVGLQKDALSRYPHEFSGGQRQRIGIARALILKPKLIVADEPVSALDVSIQSQILNLMKKLQKEFQLTYVFIAHDLAVVEHISTRIAVMYLGKIVEQADNHEIFNNPLHPYTQALISAVPQTDPKKRIKRQILQGDVPSPITPPSGCAFHPRCPQAMDRCRHEAPKIKNQNEREGENGHFVSCHLYT